MFYHNPEDRQNNALDPMNGPTNNEEKIQYKTFSEKKENRIKESRGSYNEGSLQLRTYCKVYARRKVITNPLTASEKHKLDTHMTEPAEGTPDEELWENIRHRSRELRKTQGDLS